MNIEKANKILLSIKNFINDKMNNFYIKAFLIKKIKKMTTLLTLLTIIFFLRFYTSLLKKASQFIFLIKI